MPYRHDHAAFGRLVLNADFMRAHLEQRAERVKAAAEALAAEHEVSGEFQNSFVTDSGVDGGARGDRAWAQVRNTDPNAISIEAGHLSGERGSTNRRPVEGLHTLTRALEAGGG